jgi:TetR/AcrR family transcriptional regulator
MAPPPHWERARRQEQIEYRIQEILTATARLFDQHRYEEISLAAIGQEAGFTRSNLYRYFSVKEDIFLRLLQNELSQWHRTLRELLVQPDLDPARCAECWIASLFQHPRLLRLLTLLYTLLEPQASLEALCAFKQAIKAEMDQMAALLCQRGPFQRVEAATAFILSQFALMIGFYPLLELNDRQQTAMARAGMLLDSVSYRQMLTRATEALLHAQD